MVKLIYMTAAGLTLYKALVRAGIDEDIARRVSEEVITRDEAKHFATKADVSELKATLVMWMFGLHAGTIALTVSLIQLLT